MPREFELRYKTSHTQEFHVVRAENEQSARAWAPEGAREIYVQELPLTPSWRFDAPRDNGLSPWPIISTRFGHELLMVRGIPREVTTDWRYGQIVIAAHAKTVNGIDGTYRVAGEDWYKVWEDGNEIAFGPFEKCASIAREVASRHGLMDLAK